LTSGFTQLLDMVKDQILSRFIRVLTFPELINLLWLDQE
jgi:hypothetical protein